MRVCKVCLVELARLESQLTVGDVFTVTEDAECEDGLHEGETEDRDPRWLDSDDARDRRDDR